MINVKFCFTRHVTNFFYITYKLKTILTIAYKYCDLFSHLHNKYQDDVRVKKIKFKV